MYQQNKNKTKKTLVFDKDQKLLTLHPLLSSMCNLEVYKPLLKIKLWALPTNGWSPHVILPFNFQLSLHLEHGYPLRPFICLGF